MADVVSPGVIVLVAAAFVGAGMVKGVTGMGLPTFAMAVLGGLLSPPAAAALLIVPSLVTNVWQLWAGAHFGKLLRRLWPMLAGIVVGTVGAAPFLTLADAEVSTGALGATLVAYAAYALFGLPLHTPARFEPWLSPLIGAVTGAVTGATGVFVVPAVPYLQALDLDRDDLVRALGLSFTVSTLALAAALAMRGAYQVGDLAASSLAVVPALFGMWVGQEIRRRVSPAAFGRWFLIALLLLGTEMLVRPFV